MMKTFVTLAAMGAATAALAETPPDIAAIEGVWRAAQNNIETCTQFPLHVNLNDAQDRLTISLGNWSDGDLSAQSPLTLTILSANGAVLKVRRDDDGALATITLSPDGNSYRFAVDADAGDYTTFLRCPAPTGTS